MTSTATSLPDPILGRYVQAFFGDYLTRQRRLSPNTVFSYRDAFKLFLGFAAHLCNKPVADLGFEQLAPETVLAFLDYLESSRRCSSRTRNVRLAALHSFFRYVAAHEPCLLGLCQRIIAIPVKKAPQRPPEYLEFDEVKQILAAIDLSTSLGRRDHLLIHLLFETGARAEEVATMRPCTMRLAPPFQVRILGKGDKERFCPLRKSTAALIRAYLQERGVAFDADVPLFVGLRRERLTRHGILRVVQRRVRLAATGDSALAKKKVGVHTFRHTAAIHLLRSGNALPIIRSWLGHVSVVTTDLYTQIDVKTKRQALEKCEPLGSPRRRGKATWKQDADLLAWLERL